MPYVDYNFTSSFHFPSFQALQISTMSWFHARMELLLRTGQNRHPSDTLSFFHIHNSPETQLLPQQLGKKDTWETKKCQFYSHYLRSSAEERRTSQQELVQSWVFCCGKTQFIFFMWLAHSLSQQYWHGTRKLSPFQRCIHNLKQTQVSLHQVTDFKTAFS